jgi:hypothetical protein
MQRPAFLSNFAREIKVRHTLRNDGASADPEAGAIDTGVFHCE